MPVANKNRSEGEGDSPASIGSYFNKISFSYYLHSKLNAYRLTFTLSRVLTVPRYRPPFGGPKNCKKYFGPRNNDKFMDILSIWRWCQ